MRLQPPKAIIFDNDGTLVDSEVLSIRVLAEYLGELGWPIPVQTAVARYAGQDLHVCLAEAEAAIGRPLPPDAIDVFRSRQIPILRRDLQPVPGADAMLSAVTIDKCVASNAPQEKIRVCLDTTGLRRHFDEDRIFSAYDIETWKPSPDLFLMAADRMKQHPRDCWVVEDSIFGIDASLAAGTQTIVYDPHAKFGGETRAVHRIEHLSQLTTLIADAA